MADAKELYSLFRRNLPFIVREEATALKLLGDSENHVIERRDPHGAIIAASVIHKNAIYLFCVDKAFRRQGIGSDMLAMSEAHIRSAGYSEVAVGVGEDYIMPGVPARSMAYEERLMPGDIYSGVTDEAWDFFSKRGYAHSWEDSNCFDMRQDLASFTYSEHKIGDTIDGIEYRWAAEGDIPAIKKCTDDAYEEFTQYYLDKALYAPGNSQRVLIAMSGESVCGALIVSRETEGIGTGSVGCTAVAHNWRGRHIAGNMVLLGSRYLKDEGMKTGFLGYTYSGLDRLYGIAGYKICIYYAMAQKTLK